MDEPKYYGSWKGQVIEAIVTNGAMDWTGLLDFTELSPKSLNKAIAELRQTGILTEKDGQYRVSHEVWKEYKAFFSSQETTTEDKIVEKDTQTIKGIGGVISASISSYGKQNDVKSWVNEWKKVNNLNIPIESNHFFLIGGPLDSISKGLIQNAKDEILVVNPFVEDCNLSNSILDARKKGVKVKLITRPINKSDRNCEDKQGYHVDLKQSGIILSYDKKVHAKLIVVDREVAIISSMNFIVTSSGGSSWEAGIVSMEETVVNSIADSIMSLLA
jgi:hypothetical protein